MEFVGKNRIKLDRQFGELDNFVFRFIKIIEKYVNYVIVSGYVALLFGRSRGTEDVDIFIKEMNTEVLGKLYGALIKEGFYCLNTDSVEEIYNYLKDGLGIRFAENDSNVPNIEIKLALKYLHLETFNDRVKVLTKKGDLWISSLEQQIAFKKYYLKSPKDLEDARYLEETFKKDIDYNKIEKFKELIENEKT